MKNALLSCVIIVLALCCGVACAQQPEKEVGDAVEKFRLLMIDPDSAKLSLLISDQLSYGHSAGHIDSKASFIQALMNGKSDFVTISLSDMQITLFDNTAIVRHILSAETNDNGKPGTVKLSVLMVWQKIKRQWVLIARQAVKVQ